MSARRTSSAVGTATTKFAVGDTVFAFTTDHSWFIGQVSNVSANPKYKPLTDAQKASVVADTLRKKENSAFLFSVIAQDPLFKLNEIMIHDIEEWNLDVYDESIVSRPVDDLLSVTHLHDGSILRTLAVRYMQDIVYTNIGVIVVALNPFNFKIPHYQDNKMGAYLAEKGQMISDRLLPHSWAQAHNTYHELCTTQVNQSILISGESGAGKTEAAKIVLKYLSSVSVLNGAPEAKEKANLISANVSSCSPLLECFGNAKTVRNDNSSRFGKLMKLKFDSSTLLLRGAFTTKYLLEKSRIITCGPDERLYHAFYLAYRSPTAATDNLFSDPAETYKSLYAGKCLNNKEFSTEEDYHEVCEALQCVGVSGDRLKEVWQIAAGVIHACNVAFVSDGGEGSKLSAGSDGPLKKACALWGVNYDILVAECTTSQVKVKVKEGDKIKEEITIKLLPVHKAFDVKDALCKALYGDLFEWLVEKCNQTCDEDSDSMWIALLDIFGFEDFKSGNSFEQLCINFANETLQQHYNWCIFTKDIETCKLEGIDTVDIKFPDLMPTLNMIDRIMLQLDDACTMGLTEKDYLQNITESCHKKDQAFHRDIISQETFGVHHFAGTVTYNIKNWIEKNRDTLKESLKVVFSSEETTNEISRDLFPCQARVEKAAMELLASKGGKAPKVVTLGGFFKSQMRDLMAVINSTNPHWIRCVKPHPAKKPLHFDGMYTLSQLENAGILGTVKIRKAGYPIRFSHLKFCQVFCPIAPCNPMQLTAADLRKQCLKILDQCQYNDKKFAQVGKTIVFIKNDAFHILEGHRKNALKGRCLLMQRVGRGYRRRIRTFHITLALRLQRIGKGFTARLDVFEKYLIENRDRIAAQRKLAEEQRKAAEIARAAMEVQLRESMAGFMEELDTSTLELYDSEAASWDLICQRLEQIKEALMWEQLAESIKHLVVPIIDGHEAGQKRLQSMEEDAFNRIIADAFYERVGIQTQNASDHMFNDEVRARQRIEQQYLTWASKQFEEASEVAKRVELCKEKEAYEEMLSRGRLDRARRERNSRIASDAMERTPLEREAAKLAAGYAAMKSAIAPPTTTSSSSSSPPRSGSHPSGSSAAHPSFPGPAHFLQSAPPLELGYPSNRADHHHYQSSPRPHWSKPTDGHNGGRLHRSIQGTARVPIGARVFVPQWTCYGVVVKSDVSSIGIQTLCVCVLGVHGGILGGEGLFNALHAVQEGRSPHQNPNQERWVEASEVEFEAPPPSHLSRAEMERASFPGELDSEKRRYRRQEWNIRSEHFGSELADEWDGMYWGSHANAANNNSHHQRSEELRSLSSAHRSSTSRSHTPSSRPHHHSGMVTPRQQQYSSHASSPPPNNGIPRSLYGQLPQPRQHHTMGRSRAGTATTHHQNPSLAYPNNNLHIGVDTIEDVYRGPAAAAVEDHRSFWQQQQQLIDGLADGDTYL